VATTRASLRVNRVAQAAIVVGIVVALNVVAQRWYARVDLTSGREYSLAPATRRVLAGLDDAVVVNAYFSRRLPPYLLAVRQQVQDLLEEYRARSGGRVTLEFTDPGDDPATVQRLRALGIPQLQLEVLERDAFQVTNAWLGLAILHAGRQEVIPVVQDTATLEYDLTSALLRLTNPARKAVGWLGGGDEEPGARRRGGGPLQAELGRLYELRTLDPATLEEVPEEVETLVLDGPRELPAAAVAAVDRFVLRGGRAVFLVDRLAMAPGTLAAQPVDSGLGGLLERYGAKVADDVVAEPHFNASAAFSTGFVQFRIPYPYWVRATRETLDREHPVTAKLESVVLPWASSLEAALPEGGKVRAEALARSSADAWVETAPYDFTPRPGGVRAPAGAATGARTLALLLTGQFPGPEAGQAGAETSILVVGTSRLADADFLRQFPEDGAFLLNAVDWMTMGPELIGIRSRLAPERVLPAVGDRGRALLKGANVVGVPLLVALLGVLHLAARRRRERGA
jgi:ABC-type uncharacterized transport system involved in gliding motility auxiliary subunit